MNKVLKESRIKGIDRTRRQVEVIVTRQEVDRDGDVVIAAGVDVSNFLSNPVCLREHDRSRAIGKMVALRMGTIDGAPGWIGIIEFLPPGVSADADQAYQMVLAGVLNGVSQGFLITKASPTPVLSGQTGLTIEESELLEVSLVVLQSCRSCVVTAKSYGQNDRVSVDLDEVSDLVTRAVTQWLATLIAREITTAVNAARGRID